MLFLYVLVWVVVEIKMFPCSCLLVWLTQSLAEIRNRASQHFDDAGCRNRLEKMRFPSESYWITNLASPT